MLARTSMHPPKNPKIIKLSEMIPSAQGPRLAQVTTNMPCLKKKQHSTNSPSARPKLVAVGGTQLQLFLHLQSQIEKSNELGFKRRHGLNLEI